MAFGPSTSTGVIGADGPLSVVRIRYVYLMALCLKPWTPSSPAADSVWSAVSCDSLLSPVQSL